MSLADQSLAQFLDQLSSKEPVPGGGSVAALSGALAASLLIMVCRLTVGKKGYEDVTPEMESLIDTLLPFQFDLRTLMQKDIDAYAQVIKAYTLPRQTEHDKVARTAAIQDALRVASQVPLQVAGKCAELVRLARPIAENGNKNAASDAGVACLMAEAGLRGAAFNVSINLESIHDQQFVTQCSDRVADLLTFAEKETKAILKLVEGRL